ncbi:glucose-6-phosphatase 2-like [Lineus longissimus]|uniref:glucose-6-phosphatase 2-like n=1 Tax=Lineus longissimus TaxID=88925 RepID=UPI002B4DDF5F
MDVIMAPLHQWEVQIIQELQTKFKNSSELMLFLTKLGDPRFAFLIYFPLVYFLNKRIGIQVIWIAAVSEWLNAILKWVLYGHRPYWWVHESGLYQDVPQLQQYRLTCETGPGSPSGHAMVTAAVWYAIIKAFNASTVNHRIFWSCLSWLFFILLMLSVMVSRCFIATHFPHQVLLGTVTGLLVSELFSQHFNLGPNLKTYIISSILLLTSALILHGVLDALVGNTMWSLKSATKWCGKKAWIHLDTTPYFAFTRDSASIFGVGLAQQLTKNQKEIKRSCRRKTGEVLIAVGFAIVTESMHIPQQPISVFYFLSCIKWTLVPCLVLCVVPRIGQILDISSYQKPDEKMS